jgi:dihydrofolate synthase / folylpolyglutamate synthase
MPDHAHSDDPAVQAQLNRLTMLSPGRDVLGLERIAALMERLGNPHRALPPVFHVAGTNGKGSTCAFLRAALEAAGKTVHVYTSPHLVRFNERIRVAGSLIEDVALAPLLAEVLDKSADIAPSFFEATTAVAFLAFARTPADAAIIEVGLGGRLDATNIIEEPIVCGIAQLGIDHEAFLLAPEADTPSDQAARIAFEKAGIAKPGVPLVTMAYGKAESSAIEAVAARVGARWHPKGADWDAVIYNGALGFRDALGRVKLPLPAMKGNHQVENAALAVAMIRHQSALDIPDSALRAAMGWAHWPARMQRLEAGPLVARLPPDTHVWLDGAHNRAAAGPVGLQFGQAERNRRRAIIIGILANKDVEGILFGLLHGVDQLIAVPVPGHGCHPPEEIAALATSMATRATVATSVAAAFDQLRRDDLPPGAVLVVGSLYLAGEVLRANGQVPD